MKKKRKPLSITAIPDQDKVWRLDNLGKFIVKGNYIKVQVTFTSLEDDWADKELFFEQNFDPEEKINKAVSETVEIGIGNFPFLYVGSIWKNKTLVNPVEKSTPKVDVIKATIDAPYTLNFSLMKSLIPPHYKIRIPFHEETNCVTAECKKNNYKIYIPCSEILRFYFATSTSLTRHLVNGNVEKDCLDKLIMMNDPNTKCPRTFTNGNALTVTLRKGLLDSDAWTVSRIFGEARARQEARAFYSNLWSKEQQPFDGGHCTIGFPFIGESNIEAEGMWIKKGHRNDFLVSRLLKCSYPLPYYPVYVDRETGVKSLKGANGGEISKWPHVDQKVSRKRWGDDDDIIDDDEKSDKRFVRDQFTSLENRFSFLKGKKLQKITREYANTESINRNKVATEIAGITTEDGDYSGASEGRLGTNLAVLQGNEKPPESEEERARKEAINSFFQMILEALQQLAETEELSWAVIDIENDALSSQVCLTPLWREKGMKRVSWIYLLDGSLRNLMWVQVKVKEKYYYLAELQRKENDHYFAMYVLGFGGKKVEFQELKMVMKKWILKSGACPMPGEGTDTSKWTSTVAINHPQLTKRKESTTDASELSVNDRDTLVNKFAEALKRHFFPKEKGKTK